MISSNPKWRKKMKKTKRPEWDSIWMRMADLISERSIDPRSQVGAIVVTSDNTQVLSIGYNGNYSGGPNTVESLDPGESGLIHAEINALLKLDYNNPKSKLLYVNLSPCRDCAKAMVNAGIDEVIFKNEYRDMSGVEILINAGVIVRKIALDLD